MNVLRRISYYGFLALLIYMPFHIFLAQSVSLATGGLDIWKNAKDALLFALLAFTICLVWINRTYNKAFQLLLLLSVLYGVLHVALWVFNPDIFGQSALLGMVHNLRLPGFLLLGIGAMLLNKDKFVLSSLVKLILTVSTVVASLGVLQYFLPPDLLTHLGYGLERGTRAAFFIDDNPALPRVFATLREPNALGAYLLVPVAMLVALLLEKSFKNRRLLLAGALMLHLLAIGLTFSRSAWLAMVVVIALVVWWKHKTALLAALQRFWPLLLLGAVVAGLGLFMARDAPLVKEYITHSTEEAVVDLDSNDYHILFIKEGLEGVAEQPAGHGPGTAGLASLRSPDGGKLTENYYIQIAYEVGVFGLLVFLAINIFVYKRLLKGKRTVLAIALLASFWGYVLTNMLLHTWGNETVAAQWWLLAGAALCALPDKNKADKV